MEQKPSIGRIVHYKVKDDDDDQIKNNGHVAGSILPAIIVGVFPDEYGPDEPGVNISIFTDGSGIQRKFSVAFGDEEGQCNWPART